MSEPDDVDRAQWLKEQGKPLPEGWAEYLEDDDDAENAEVVDGMESDDRGEPGTGRAGAVEVE